MRYLKCFFYPNSTVKFQFDTILTGDGEPADGNTEHKQQNTALQNGASDEGMKEQL